MHGMLEIYIIVQLVGKKAVRRNLAKRTKVEDEDFIRCVFFCFLVLLRWIWEVAQCRCTIDRVENTAHALQHENNVYCMFRIRIAVVCPRNSQLRSSTSPYGTYDEGFFACA